jgi:hypothetical protein
MMMKPSNLGSASAAKEATKSRGELLKGTAEEAAKQQLNYPENLQMLGII